MPGRPEGDALGRIARIGLQVVVRGDQRIEIDELFGLSGPARLGADDHGIASGPIVPHRTGDPAMIARMAAWMDRAAVL